MHPAVQPCSLATPAALLLYNMISGAAHISASQFISAPPICSVSVNHLKLEVTLQAYSYELELELELELIQTQMAQKPMLREEVGMRVRCANKASAE